MLTRDEVHPARRAWVPLVLAGLLLAVLAGCAGSAGAPSSPGPATPGDHTTGAPSAGRSPAPSPAPAAAPSRTCAGRVLARMTLPQRVGQLFVVGLAGSVLDSATASAI